MKVEDIAVAARSPRFRKLAEIAKSIRDGNESGRYRDLPVKRQSPEAGARKSMNGVPSAQDIVAAVATLTSELKRRETRQRKRGEKDQALRKSLTEDDLRLGSDAMSVLAGLRNEQGEMDV